MLVLSRNPSRYSAMTDERSYFTIKIPPQTTETTIKITVIESNSYIARIGIDAPRFCQVDRPDSRLHRERNQSEESGKCQTN